ncbi:MAG: hypothetical protein ACRDNK_24265 [Solirubrobacteraceae bacterium]
MVVVAAVAGALAVKQSARTVSAGAATVQLLVDSPQSSLANLRQDPTLLAERASELAQAVTSPQALRSIGARAGVPANELTAEGPFTGVGLGLNVETPSAARGIQLVSNSSPYHLTFVPQSAIPVITVSVLGPTPEAAGRVATAVAPGVRAWLRRYQVPNSNPAALVTIRQLGSAQAGVVNSGSSKVLAGITGAGILILGLLAVIGIGGRRARRKAEMQQLAPTLEPDRSTTTGFPHERTASTESEAAVLATSAVPDGRPNGSAPEQAGPFGTVAEPALDAYPESSDDVQTADDFSEPEWANGHREAVRWSPHRAAIRWWRNAD